MFNSTMDEYLFGRHPSEAPAVRDSEVDTHSIQTSISADNGEVDEDTSSPGTPCAVAESGLGLAASLTGTSAASTADRTSGSCPL